MEKKVKQVFKKGKATLNPRRQWSTLEIPNAVSHNKPKVLAKVNVSEQRENAKNTGAIKILHMRTHQQVLKQSLYNIQWKMQKSGNSSMMTNI